MQITANILIWKNYCYCHYAISLHEDIFLYKTGIIVLGGKNVRQKAEKVGKI